MGGGGGSWKFLSTGSIYKWDDPPSKLGEGDFGSSNKGPFRKKNKNTQKDGICSMDYSGSYFLGSRDYNGLHIPGI